MIFKIMKVSGNSLYPLYRDGDFVVLSKIPILVSGIHPADIIVFKHPRYGLMVKRVLRVENDGKYLFVIGENDESVDSRRFGDIPLEWVLAKVIWHIRSG